MLDWQVYDCKNKAMLPPDKKILKRRGKKDSQEDRSSFITGFESKDCSGANESAECTCHRIYNDGTFQVRTSAFVQNESDLYLHRIYMSDNQEAAFRSLSESITKLVEKYYEAVDVDGDASFDADGDLVNPMDTDDSSEQSSTSEDRNTSKENSDGAGRENADGKGKKFRSMTRGSMGDREQIRRRSGRASSEPGSQREKRSRSSGRDRGSRHDSSEGSGDNKSGSVRNDRKHNRRIDDDDGAVDSDGLVDVQNHKNASSRDFSPESDSDADDSHDRHSQSRNRLTKEDRLEIEEDVKQVQAMIKADPDFTDEVSEDQERSNSDAEDKKSRANASTKAQGERDPNDEVNVLNRGQNAKTNGTTMKGQKAATTPPYVRCKKLLTTLLGSEKRIINHDPDWEYKKFLKLNPTNAEVKGCGLARVSEYFDPEASKEKKVRLGPYMLKLQTCAKDKHCGPYTEQQFQNCITHVAMGHFMNIHMQSKFKKDCQCYTVVPEGRKGSVTAKPNPSCAETLEQIAYNDGSGNRIDPLMNIAFGFVQKWSHLKDDLIQKFKASLSIRKERKMRR